MTTDWQRHWATPEWRSSVEAWIDRAVCPLSINRTGPTEEHTSRLWSVVLKVRTDHGMAWFKENCPGQRGEAGIVQALVGIAPDHVVRPLAVDAERGWLLMQDHGATLASRGATTEDVWMDVVTRYADLQRQTEPYGVLLGAAGLEQVPPDRLTTSVRACIDRLAAMPDGHPVRVDADVVSAARGALDRLDELAAELAAGPVPCALEHNDLHHDNAFVAAPGESGLRFFDFGDALWAHPFCSLFVTRDVIAREWETHEDDPRLVRIVDAYLERWTDLASIGEVRALLEIALRVAPAHRFISWERCFAGAGLDVDLGIASKPGFWLSRLVGAVSTPVS